MRVYLDLCCLKRPFDDQSQPRVHLESEAVLTVLSASNPQFEFVHAPAHDLENKYNPLPRRAARVQNWLDAQPMPELSEQTLAVRTSELIQLGFRNFDALHVASAEDAHAEVFVTCDDRLLAVAARHQAALHVRVLDLLAFAREVVP